MKQQILPFLIGLFCINLTFSQPIVMVKGSEDALAVKRQIIQYLDELDIGENIHLSVSFSRHLPENVKGMTFCLPSTAPETYQIIRVRIEASLNKTQQNIVLAHEMVHVKQFTTGELIMINNQQVRWKGQKYWCVGGCRRSAPWEEEAYQIGNELVRQENEQLPTIPLVAADKSR